MRTSDKVARGAMLKRAEQLQPARLAGGVQFGDGGVRAGAAIGLGGGVETGAVHAERLRQRLEEGDALAGLHAAVAVEDVGGEGDPRGLALSGEQILAALHQGCRLGGAADAIGALQQGAAALRDARQEVAEEGGVGTHGLRSP